MHKTHNEGTNDIEGKKNGSSSVKIALHQTKKTQEAFEKCCDTTLSAQDA